jgi:3D (Asp-Asp-Asp) domain-containing protein
MPDQAGISMEDDTDDLPGLPVEGYPDVRAGAFGSGKGLLGIRVANRKPNKPVVFDPKATGCPGPFQTRTMEVTGYTSGPESTGKRPGDHGYGQGKYGTMVGPGSIAAPKPPFTQGDQLFVPGYGLGTVNDTGGAIKGDRLDLWFATPDEARQRGRRLVPVEICGPSSSGGMS